MERRKQLAYLGNGGEEAARAHWRPRRRAVSTRRGYGTGVAVRLAGAAGQQWCHEVIGAWGGVGTADAHEAVATTDVGRGGGGVLGVAGRVAWAQGRGIGEERKEEDGSGIYMPRPFNPGAIPPPGVKVLYSRCVLPTGSKGIPLLPVGKTHRE